jgi:predicted acyltransferase
MRRRDRLIAGGAGSLVVSCNFPGYLDEIVLDGFRWNNPAFDPDGLGAILPAITSVLFGVLAGQLLLTNDKRQQQIVGLLGGGIVLIAAGELLAIWVPINKQLWTPSFAIFTSGLAATMRNPMDCGQDSDASRTAFR